ncbi:MAG: RiPP maturation radical SAM C-methyltransferase, partial [Anaerolineae bacterium]|nr:RiPP maturation radical SAM C-methyltransferase [Anaerolineae bacterium]
MNKVMLVSMPFGALERQSIGLSLLKAALTQVDIACDVRYLTFAFAEFIGFEEYQWLSFEMPYTAFAGDWAFTEALYGERPAVDHAYVEEVLVQKWQLDENTIRRLLRIRSYVQHFIHYCLDAVSWEDYSIVGFTSTFEQNIASLALARQLKALYPQISIVFGGANWEGEMGCELHRQFEFVDFVCSGEADESFPALARHILAGEPVESYAASIPGISYRQGGETLYTGQAPMIADMDALPIPDYSDYFADVGQSTVGASVVPVLLVETSRGCWWGVKSHCTFCGLNGGTMSFRSKSAHRALDELEFLVDRWRVEFVEVVDNILDMRYFHDMLPALAQAGRPLQIFYEVKANLNRRHLEVLRSAGVTRIQPGIESMSDHVLKLMRKGTSAMINIQLLKWCQEYGIAVDW